MIPQRLPLNTPTLTHILRQCATATARRRVIQREIGLVSAGRDFGTLSKHQALVHLDRITWALFNAPPIKLDLIICDELQVAK